MNRRIFRPVTRPRTDDMRSSLKQWLRSFHNNLRSPNDVAVGRKQSNEGNCQRCTALLTTIYCSAIFKETSPLVYATLPFERFQFAGPPAIHPEVLKMAWYTVSSNQYDNIQYNYISSTRLQCTLSWYGPIAISERAQHRSLLQRRWTVYAATKQCKKRLHVTS